MPGTNVARIGAILVLILVVASASYFIAIRNGAQTTAPLESGGNNTILIVSTFPGVSDDVRQLVKGCPAISVVSLAPPGVDPHEYTLKPDQISLLSRASLVISTGHAPFENNVARYVGSSKLILIPSIPGLEILKLPTGAENLHMPIYMPSNYMRFINYTSTRLESIAPNCRDTIMENTREAIENTTLLNKKYAGILAGKEAVAGSPAVEYPAYWLGLNISVYLTLQYGAQSSPQSVIEAKNILEKGGIAVIIVNSQEQPLGTVDKSLEKLAEQANAPILKIPAPFLPGSTLSKMWEIGSQAESIKSLVG